MKQPPLAGRCPTGCLRQASTSLLGSRINLGPPAPFPMVFSETSSMSAPSDGIEGGHYARKQLYGGAWLITWSHRRRFQLALRLAARFRGRRLLDYGCGDGTFLAMACDGPVAPAESVGAEISDPLVNDCRTRLGGRAGLSFVTVADLAGPGSEGRFDALFSWRYWSTWSTGSRSSTLGSAAPPRAGRSSSASRTRPARRTGRQAARSPVGQMVRD